MSKEFNRDKLKTIVTIVNFVYLYSIAKNAKEQHDKNNTEENDDDDI